MKITHKTSLFVTGALASIAAAYNVIDVATPAAPPPPIMEWGGDQPAASHWAANGTRAELINLVAGQKVLVAWTKDGVSDYQSIALSYWPTYCVGLPDGVIFVAGYTERGATIIERIVLAEPIVSLAQNPITGLFVESLQMQPLQSRRRVFAEVNPDRSMIDWMIPMLHDPGVFLVKYWTSKLVCTIDTTTEQVVEVAGPELSPPGFTQGELDRNFELTWAADHSIEGYLYMVTVGATNVTLDPALHSEADFLAARLVDLPIALLDADRDGVIDEVLIANKSVRQARQLTEPSLLTFPY